MADHSRERKKIFVNRMIQGRMLMHLAIYWGIYHVVLWHGMFIFRYVEYRSQLLTDPQMVHLSFGQLYGNFVGQHSAMILCVLAVFPLILWDMMKVTHRVAGPLVRFGNTLKRLEQGEKVQEVRLRKGDLLVGFQDAFNSYLKAANLLIEDEKDSDPKKETQTTGSENGRSGDEQSPYPGERKDAGQTHDPLENSDELTGWDDNLETVEQTPCDVAEMNSTGEPLTAATSAGNNGHGS